MNWIEETLGYLQLGYFYNIQNDYSTYVIINGTKPTEEELKIQYKNVLKINCKNKSKALISACDWSVLTDVKLINYSQFVEYRAILRDYILNPVENPNFPDEPQPIWAI